MNHAIKSSIGVLIALNCAAGHAASWMVISEDQAHRTTVDRDSVVKQGDLVSLWVRTEYLIASDQPVVRNQKVSRVVTKWRIKCGTRMVSAGPSVFYNREGGAVAPVSDLPLDFEDIFPDSAADTARRMLCR